VHVPGGLETGAQNVEKTPDSQTGDAKSGAFPAEIEQIDADLQAVIDSWTTLPAVLKSGILAMVNAAYRTAR
jgi:hypothetical protein